MYEFGGEGCVEKGCIGIGTRRMAQKWIRLMIGKVRYLPYLTKVIYLVVSLD